MVIAFCATDGGSAGPTTATPAVGAGPFPCDGAPAAPLAPEAVGAKVFVWPFGSVTVTVLVTLLTTTVLWTLLKMTLFRGAASTPGDKFPARLAAAIARRNEQHTGISRTLLHCGLGPPRRPQADSGQCFPVRGIGRIECAYP